MCLKIENCYLKTFVEIRVSEKVCGNTCLVARVEKQSPNFPYLACEIELFSKKI